MHSADPWEDDDDTVVPLRRGAGSSAGQQGTYMAAEAPKLRVVTARQLGIDDLIGLTLREAWLIVVVFCVVFGLGAALALAMPKSYTANASLLMSLSKDYVYRPLAGDAANGATSTIDQVVQSEVEILSSDIVKQRVVARLGYRVILPNAAQLWNPVTPDARAKSDLAAMQVLQTGFTTQTAPADDVVRLSFKHSDPKSAALILNTIIDVYQARRLEVYGDTLGPLLQQQKAAAYGQLAAADQAYQAFLAQNGVGDFDATKATYSKVWDLAQADLYATQAQISQDNAKLAAVNANLATLSPEMSTERDLDLSIPTRILALQQQRQELLGHYLPTAQPVVDIDAQIASLQALVNSGAGIGEKDHKLGTNTVYQAVLQQKLDLEADLASQTGRRAQDQAQADQTNAKLQGLLGIEAQYNSLSTERATLQDTIKSFDQRIQENSASNAMAKGANDSVRVVEKASEPDKPKSLKRIALIFAFLFAAITALSAGALRGITRKGFFNAAMASKALDLPVLAQAGVKAA